MEFCVIFKKALNTFPGFFYASDGSNWKIYNKHVQLLAGNALSAFFIVVQSYIYSYSHS